MPGPGSQEPYGIKTGRKVTTRTGEPARFEPLQFDAARRNQPLQSRVRSFPVRTITSQPRVTAQPAQVPRVEAGPAQTAPPATARPVAADRPQSGLTQSVLRVVARAGRLTWDATLILIFSPVIAVWWLLERRHRKGR
jgi:hypothetical protein